VVNARLTKPLDEAMILRYAKPGGIIITLEEGVVAGGFGSSVREALDRKKRFDIRFKSIGLPTEIYPVGKVDQIKSWYSLDEDGLIRQIKEFITAK